VCDRRTDGWTEFSSLDRICITCSAVKTILVLLNLCQTFHFPAMTSWPV